MCRLLGVVSATPITVADAVGDAVLKDFVALTKVHGDGWGVAAVGKPGELPAAEVSAGTALDDPAFFAATHDRRSVATIAHLRWATSGLAVQPQNSHPFVADGLAMAHNGSIKPMAPLDGLLEPDIAVSLRGTTDSERYFGAGPPAPPHRAESRRGGPARREPTAAGLSRRQPQRAAARRGPTHRRPRARPQHAAR